MEIAPRKNRTDRKPLLKALALAVFIVAAILVVRFTPAAGYLTAETLGRVLGAAIFGPYLGFAYVWVGAMLGASAAFRIGRTLGREFAASRIGDRLKQYDEAIDLFVFSFFIPKIIRKVKGEPP